MRYAKILALALLAVAPSTYAQVKISDLPAASALGGTEELPVVQAGVTRGALASQVAAYVNNALAGLGTFTPAGSWTFGNVSSISSPSLRVMSASPQFEMHDSDSAVNTRRWNWQTSGANLNYRACNDAGNSCTTYLTIARSNEIANSITIGDTTGNPSIIVPGSGMWVIGGSSGAVGNVLTSNGSGVAPTWQAVGGSGSFPYRAVKTSITIRQSTTTLADDPELTFASVPAGTYMVDGFINATANTDEPDLKIALRGTTAGTAANSVMWTYVTATSASNGFTSIASATPTSGVVLLTAVTTLIRVTGTLVLTSTGTVAIQWAQNTSAAVNTSVVQGSWLRLSPTS